MARPEVTGRKVFADTSANPPPEADAGASPPPKAAAESDPTKKKTAKKRKKRTPKPKLPPPLLAMSIGEFCAAHQRFSLDFFFKLKRAGLGPREMQFGHKVLISIEAAAEWRRQRIRDRRSESRGRSATRARSRRRSRGPSRIDPAACTVAGRRAVGRAGEPLSYR